MRTGVAVVVLFASCAKSTDHLPRPAWVQSVSTHGGLCGRTLAVDGQGDFWSEGGCENGEILLRRRHHADDATAERVREGFNFLRVFECPPGPVDENGDVVLADEQVTYELYQREGQASWSKCAVDGGEPFTSLDAAFEAL